MMAYALPAVKSTLLHIYLAHQAGTETEADKALGEDHVQTVQQLLFGLMGGTSVTLHMLWLDPVCSARTGAHVRNCRRCNADLLLHNALLHRELPTVRQQGQNGTQNMA